MSLDPRERQQQRFDARHFASLLDQVTRDVRDLQRTPQLAHSAIMNGALTAYVNSTQTMIIGVQYDGTNAAVPVSSPKPPTPAAPTAVPRPGGIAVGWTGLFADALGVVQTSIVAPMDFARVDVVVSSDNVPDWLATLPSHAFTSPRGGEIFISLPADNYRVVLIARGQAGNASNPSVATDVTALPVVEPSDGEEPQGQPQISVIGGLGAISIRVTTPVVNNDPVTYEYHVSPVPFSAVPADAATIAHQGPETAVTVRRYPNGDPIGPDNIGEAPAPVYVRVIAKDDDGWGPQSAQSFATPVLVTSADIAANQGWFGYLQAVDFRSGSITGDVGLFGRLATLGAGENVGQGWEAGALGARWFNAQGKVVVSIPYNLSDDNPATFTGKGVFSQLEATSGMTMRGVSQVAQGAEVRLANQQGPPSIAPTVGMDLEAVTLDLPAAYAALTGGVAAVRMLGIQYDTTGAEWWVAALFDQYLRILRFNPTTGAYKGQQVAIDLYPSGTWTYARSWAYTTGASPRHVVSTPNWLYFFTAAGAAADANLQAFPPGTAPSGYFGLGNDGADMLLTDFDATGILRTRLFVPGQAEGSNSAPPTSSLNGWTFNNSGQGTAAAAAVGGALTMRNPANTAAVFLTSPMSTGVGGAIQEGGVYTVSCTIDTAGTADNNVTQRLQIDWFDASNNLLASDIRSVTSKASQVVTFEAPAPYLANKFQIIFTHKPSNLNGQNGTSSFYNLRMVKTSGWNVTNLWRSASAAWSANERNNNYGNARVTGVARRTDADMGNVERIVVGPSSANPDASIVPYRTANGNTDGHGWKGPQSVSAEGFAFAAGNYYAYAGGRVYKFGTVTWADTITTSMWWAGYTWRDTNASGGTHETGLSPMTSFAMRKRHRVTITTGPVPGGLGVDAVNAIGFYVGRAAIVSPIYTASPNDPIWTVTTRDSGGNPIAHGLTVGDRLATPESTTSFAVLSTPTTSTFTTPYVYPAPFGGYPLVRANVPARTSMAYQSDLPAPSTLTAAGVLTNPNPTAATSTNTITGLAYGPDPAGTYAFPNTSPGKVISTAKRNTISNCPCSGSTATATAVGTTSCPRVRSSCSAARSSQPTGRSATARPCQQPSTRTSTSGSADRPHRGA